MRYIHFIVNPISGNGLHRIDKTELQRYFPKESFRIEVDYSNYKRHAVLLTQNAILKKPNCIVACGGDGTINEVASCLINTEIKLGIIPVGSGNGLASHLKIPVDMETAALIIRKGYSQAIDVGKVNEYYFFSNMGIGIDAAIIKKYESYSKRTLFSYVRASLSSSFQFTPLKAVFILNDQFIETNFFLLFISNSNEMGYGMSLTPKASLTDGRLDLLMVSELSFINKLRLAICIVNNRTEKFKKARHSLIETMKVEVPDRIFLDTQIDGEFHNLKTNTIEISVIKNGLNVLIGAN